MTSAFALDGVGPWIEKDANAVLDYHVCWADWLDGDTIASVTWTVQSGLTKDSQSVNASPVTIDGTAHAANTVATAWLSGGTAGQTYSVACRVVTAGGRTDERTFRVRVANR